MSKTRIEEIEILRGFAFVAVVLQHAIGHYYPMPSATLEDGVILGIFLILSKFAVPIFIFITGLVLFYNYDGDIRYGTFIRKRFKDILLPYLPWAVLYAVVFHQLNLLEAGSLSKLGMLVFTGTASYHLWYIVMIFQFYLLFPFLLRFIQRIKPKSARTALIAVLSLGLLYLLLMVLKGPIYQTAVLLDIPFITAFFTTYMDRNALMFFFYFVLGAAAGLYFEQWRALLIRFRYLIMSVFGASLLWMLYVVIARFELSPNVLIKYDDLLLLSPSMAVFLTLSVLAIYICSIYFIQGAPALLRKMFDLAGSYSYVGYLAHAFMLGVAFNIVDSLLPGSSVTVRTLISFVLSSVGSILIAFVLRFIAKRVKAYRNRRHDSQISKDKLNHST